jgi:hypothetical protein
MASDPIAHWCASHTTPDVHRDTGRYTAVCGTLGASVKRQRHSRQFTTYRQRKDIEQPTHKTAHSQAPTHKPMLQLAKEQFFPTLPGSPTILQNC